MQKSNDKQEKTSARYLVENAHIRASAIVIAIGASIVVYLVVGHFVLQSLMPVDIAARKPLYIAALGLILFSVVFRRFQFRAAKLESIATKRGIKGLTNYLVSSTIISSAAGEAVALIGLLLTVMGGDQWDLIKLGVAGLAVTFLHYPRHIPWIRMVEYFANALGEEVAEGDGQQVPHKVLGLDNEKE